MARDLLDGDTDPEYPSVEGDSRESSSGMSLMDRARFLLNAARRRKLVAAAVFLGCIGLVFAVYRFKQPMYRVETRLLTQRQQALPSLVRPGVPDDSPTRSAYELIHRRENLVALLTEANMASGSPGPPKPGVLELLGLGEGGPDDDPMDLLVKRLDRALEVSVAEGTITIRLDWPDPQQAYQLVEAALQNFLEARQLQDVKAIDDAISLLRGRLAPLRAQLDAAIDEVHRESASAPEALPVPAPSRARPADPAHVEELGRLRAAIEAKERAIRDTEEFRRRRLLELQAQLEERRVVYSEAHPSIVGLRREIEGLARESSQVAALREEDRQLRAQYAALSGEQAGTRAGPDRGGGARRARPISNASVDQSERVRDARFQYQQMAERVSAAQTDLDNARAAFKFRYSIVWPAEVPRKPVSPNPLKYLGVGTLASLILALLAAAGPDLVSGRILERWHVERGLNVPVLAELSRRE
jgi:uncharacterized protein involved in exopolysaccharide biosynthesis